MSFTFRKKIRAFLNLSVEVDASNRPAPRNAVASGSANPQPAGTQSTAELPNELNLLREASSICATDITKL